MKRSRLFIGAMLLVQSVSLLFMFALLYGKKRGLSVALLAAALAGGIAGVSLLNTDGVRPHLRRKAPKRPVAIDREDEDLFEEPNSDEVEICDDYYGI